MTAVDTGDALGVATTASNNSAVRPPSVGALRVGMSIAEAEATGQARYDDGGGMAAPSLNIEQDGLYVCVDSDQTIASFILKDGNPWASPEGIQLGSSDEEIGAAYSNVRASDLGQQYLLVDNGNWGYQFYLDQGEVAIVAFGEDVGREVVFDC